MENKKILVLCTGNSCRSQIAEGYLKFFLKNRANVYSAGVDNHEINKLAIKTMKDDGIDISKQVSNNINEFNSVKFDHIITVCDNAEQVCPNFPGNVERLHWSIDDPFRGWDSDPSHLNNFRDTIKDVKDNIIKFLNQMEDQ